MEDLGVNAVHEDHHDSFYLLPSKLKFKRVYYLPGGSIFHRMQIVPCVYSHT